MLHKLILATVAIGQQPHEVRRIAVVQVRRISIAERVHLMSEHIADTACRTARAATLVKYSREMLEISIIPMIRELTCSRLAQNLGTSTVASHLAEPQQAGFRLPRLLRINIVRISIAIDRHSVHLPLFTSTLSISHQRSHQCHQEQK